MSRGLRPVGSAFETLDEGVEINLDTHAYSFEGDGVAVATDAVNPNLVHVVVSAGVVGGGPPTTIDAGDVPVVGVAPTASHSDHEHGVNTGIAADIQPTGVAASAGVSLALPRADHVHRLELLVGEEGVFVGARPAINFIGSSVTAVDNPGSDRVDITVSAAALGGALPIQVDAGDAGTAGVAVAASREDHEHPVNTLSAPAAPAAVAAAGAAGVALTLVRGDHVHALPIQWRTYQATWAKDAADVLGTTTTVQRAFDRNGMVAGAVWTFVSGFFVPNAAVPAGAMGNTATLSIVVRTAAGVIVGTLGTITVGAAWGANVPQAVVAGAVLVVNPGEYLTVAIAKTGVAGRVIPAGALELTFTVS